MDDFESLQDQIKRFADTAEAHRPRPQDLMALAMALAPNFDRDIDETLILLREEWKKRGLTWVE